MEIFSNQKPGFAVLICLSFFALSSIPNTAGKHEEGHVESDLDTVHAHAANESFQHLVNELNPSHPHSSPPFIVRSGETSKLGYAQGAGADVPKVIDNQRQENLSKPLPVTELNKLKKASKNSDRVARAAHDHAHHKTGGGNSKNGDKDDDDDDDGDGDDDDDKKKHTRSLDSIDDLLTKKSDNYLNQVDATLFRAKRFCGFSPKVDPSRLSNASPGQFPWSVAILSEDNAFLCAGTLISEELVLTTASCISNYRKNSNKALKAVLGAWSLPDGHQFLPEFQVFVRSAVLHPSYSEDNAETRSHNIGILQLFEKVDFDLHPHIFPVCIIGPQFETFATTTDCRILGWPEMPHMEIWRSSSYLAWGNVKIGGNDCGGATNMLCATGRTCVANEGSPIICLANSNRYYQLGIVPSDLHCEPPSSQSSASISAVNVIKNHDFIEKYFKTGKI